MDWGLSNVLTLLFMIFGGTMLFIALFLVEAAFCFFTIADGGILNMLTYGAKEHGKYPMDIYGKGIMNFCTYIIPYALVQYYPLLYLIGRSENIGLIFLPLLGFLFTLPCYGFFRYGLRKYQSAGS